MLHEAHPKGLHHIEAASLRAGGIYQDFLGLVSSLSPLELISFWWVKYLFFNCWLDMNPILQKLPGTCIQSCSCGTPYHLGGIQLFPFETHVNRENYESQHCIIVVKLSLMRGC